jgi:hypothetical protein
MDIDKKIAKIRHQQQLNKLTSVEGTLASSVSRLIRFLDNKTTKTEVVNQLKEIGTPDALKVVAAVNEVHEHLKTLKNTDLSEVTDLLKGILDKKQPEVKIPEQKDTIKVSNLKDIDFATLEKAIEKAITNQKAPVVNVPKTTVQVAAPDMSALKEIVQAVKEITYPEIPKTDLTTVEQNTEKTNQQLEEANKKLQKLVEKPTGGGGGVSSFKNASGKIVNADTVVVSGKNAVVVANADGTAVGSTLPTGAATSAKQDTGNTSLISIDTKLDALTTPTDTQPVSAVSLPLPSGAATSAKQDTAQTTLTSIDTNIALQLAPGKLRYTNIISASTTITPTSGKAIEVIKIQVVPASANASDVQIYINFATSLQDVFKGYAGGGYGVFTGNTNEVLTITQTGTGSVQILVDYNEI